MSDQNKHKEVCELLKIWFYIKNNGMSWSTALNALEERIEIMLKEKE